jgi:hypothetical protein
VHLQQERRKHQCRRRGGPLQHRHFQDQAADPLGGLGRDEQAHVGAQRDPSQHHLIHAQLIQQAQHLLGVQIHPVSARVARLLAPAVTQQVKQHDTVTPGGQSAGQAAAEVGVEEQTVQPDQHPVARAVDLIGQPVPAVGQRVPRAFQAWLRVVPRRHPGTRSALG